MSGLEAGRAAVEAMAVPWSVKGYEVRIRAESEPGAVIGV
ncbi:phosphoesterase, PA-phosphatase-like [Pseudomonas mandelii JR-1]|uniref:Phosphoesterase, PA-phosphatase-like n=1 Tax=Pseudomonas mandelii JR-1 TaxID=1147786 RepID=A0A024EGE6_9PSED|nr:phosphoesterase, PA-phosphatase-like [Pseudomonas mandelii JR-1]